YRAVFTGGCGSATSDAIALDIAAPAVTVDPTDVGACLGAAGALSAAATYASTVQWEASSDGGVTFAPVAGATQATYAFTVSAANVGLAYRAVFTGPCGTATSRAAFIREAAAPAIATQPADVTACAGDLATFSAAASGFGAQQWQASADGG